MADLQKTSTGGNIVYPNASLFKDGGIGADGKAYPKVDMSVFDQATMCGTCHVGGPFYEHDRNGLRLPIKAYMDMGMMMANQPYINPFTSTVWESYTAAGADTSFVTLAPWIYPQYNKNNPAFGAMMAPYGWGMSMSMPNPNGTNDPTASDAYVIEDGQLMMPNVKETDCLFCHLKGYDNVMSSVMTQAGSLNAAPAAGASLFDIMPASPTYMGYDSMKGNLAFTNVSTSYGRDAMQMVSFTPTFVSKILAKPDENNCHQCHATKTLKDMPEMFGVTGTSTGFLSSAPMIYDPANPWGPLGKRMTAFDINAMWKFSGNSDVIDFSNYMSYMMGSVAFPQAFGVTPLNAATAAANTNGFIGGGNPAMTGPLYYYNDSTTPDQNVLKRSVPVFARAEWLKRGDAWQDGQDVHGNFGCAGCHYTGDSTHKNQCDPGRGFDMASGIQDGVPPLSKRQVVTGYDANGVPIIAANGAEATAAVQGADTRNTIKRCEFCHITGKDYYGNYIDTFSAPNPTAAHQAAGLTANIVQMIDKYELSGVTGGYGGQGIPMDTSAAKLKAMSATGSHLDVMDCTVCHVQKKSMVVRSLDASSGMRYPSVLGTDNSKGMIGLFEDPAPDTFNEAMRQRMNQMYEAMGMGPNYIPAGTHVVGSPLQEWKPLHIWQKLGNMELPLTVDNVTAGNGDASQMNFRRKIYLTNPISAILWNNTDSTIDANGDTATGGILDENKESLTGYTDIFTNMPVNKNNTQGYGEPIYDPWIMRDLKAGFNFGPSALSVISIGFGPLDGTDHRASAYMQDNTFSTASYWKYVSIWSGAVTFTEPNQIREYKEFRGPSWAGTELTFVGAPFMITHGVKETAVHVKGKDKFDSNGNLISSGCTDCHASGKEFFNGGFIMTGTAVPAERTFDPTAMIAPNAVQNAQGDFVRPAGFSTDGGVTHPFESASTLMERPLEPYRVKAYKGDMFTAFEGMNKLGQPRSTEFHSEYTDPVTHEEFVYTRDIERAEVLYPPEKNDDGSELKIYCKISDDCAANPGLLMNGPEYATYLETAAVANPASFGIGVDPVATINSISDADPVKMGTQKVVNTAFTVSAADAQTGGFVKYAWSAYGATITNGNTQTATITFTSAGSRTITLTVTDEENKVRTTTATIDVIATVPMGISWFDNTGAGIKSGTLTASSLPAGTTKVTIYWGDGGITNKTTGIANDPLDDPDKGIFTTATRNYATAGNKLVKVYAYNGTTLLSSTQATITVSSTN